MRQVNAPVRIEVCDTCHGTRKLIDWDSSLGYAGEPVEVPCHACDGQGSWEAEADPYALTETEADPFGWREAAE